MKKVFSTLLIAMLALCSFAADGGKTAYDIKLNVPSAKNQKVFLAFYFNGKTYSKDTTILDAKGKGEIKGTKPLDQGIYIIYFDSNKYFDLLVGADQNIVVKADTAHLSEAQISGSKESSDFQSLVGFMAAHHKKQSELNQEYNSKKIDSVKYNTEMDKLSEEVIAYQKKIMDENKGKWLEAFIKGTIPVEVPDFNEVADSIRPYTKYQYKKHHYFDNVNLSDARFLRTPYFPSMVDNYLSKYLLQHPDTLYEAAVELIEKSRFNKETFQTMCSKMINYGLQSNQMGIDALWSKLATKYYLTEPRQATWADSSWVEDLRKEVKKVRYNLIGMKAKDLRMKDSTGAPMNLSDLNPKDPKNKFVLVYFFEPTCGHCRHTTPILHDSVYAMYHKYGFEVFCCYTQTNRKEWMDFVEKNHMQDWVNVWDPDRESYFWEFFDASVTPGIYLLDQDRKIIAKKIDMKTLGMILEEELIKRPEAEAKKKAEGKK